MPNPPMLSLPRLELRAPACANELHELTRFGPQGAEGAPVYLWADLLEELIYASLELPERQQTALLLGVRACGVDGPFVELRGYTDLREQQELLRFCAELNEDWEQIHTRMARRDDRLQIVGWLHLGRGAHQGGQLARVSQMIQRTFFNLGHELVLSIDPEARTVALFGFDENALLVHTGFSLVRRRSPEPSTPTSLR